MQTLYNILNILKNKSKHYIIYYVIFIKYLWISKISLVSIILTEKAFIYPFNLVFFMLSIVKSLEILCKHNDYGCIFESFALNQYIFAVLTNEELLLPS